jgi:LPS export ABC transporter protein LptC
MAQYRQKKSEVFNTKQRINPGRTLLCGFCVLFCVVSCTNIEKPEKIAAVANRSAMPRLHATDITTVISDSGITRYRIAAPCWNIYDKANQPYWEFPQGIHFERFDLKLKVDANIRSDYAKFKENEQLWELRGNVKMTNIQGQLFETPQLFWNQNLEKFYSDSTIKITDATHIVKGIGFESNQNMTNYHIRVVKGIFPVDKKQ